MTVTPYRVGIFQYLILGALAQAPHMALTEAQLRAHFNRHRVDVTMPTLLKTLTNRGAIDFDDRLGKWCLTGYGQEARCAKSRVTKERFLSVEWSGVLEMADAS